VRYVDCVRRMLLAELPSLEGKPELLDSYALLVLVQGSRVTLSDVHDAWSVWRFRTNPEHPALVPFSCLDSETQEKDRKYTEAIARVSRKLAGGGRDV